LRVAHSGKAVIQYKHNAKHKKMMCASLCVELDASLAEMTIFLKGSPGLVALTWLLAP
jgi:hypothetical protein